MSTSLTTRPKILLFDIDGTVLDPQDGLHGGIGREFLTMIKALADQQYEFVFITGNDFDFQKHRVLDPVIQAGIGPQVFCFSDGGSRAFEFNKSKKRFEEINAYSKENLMSDAQVKTIEKTFQDALKDFLKEPENDPLRRPHIRWHERTLEYLDIRIFPIKPSFLKPSKFKKFCDEIIDLSKSDDMGPTVFQLIRTYPGSLIIRAVSRNPEFDANLLQNFISQNLMHKEEYKDLSMPELEKRGGEGTKCQIALKPFNNNAKRMEFRNIIDDKLKDKIATEFSVLLGGNTTIDIQRKGVNKEKAIKFLLDRRSDLKPQNMIYFGNEFNKFGNDRSVAEMNEKDRPGFIINVGNSVDDSEELSGILIEDGNGPRGTLNFLKYLLYIGRYISDDIAKNVEILPVTRGELLIIIENHFNLPELKKLCFSFGIDIDNLPGQTKTDKSIELINYCTRHGTFEDLVSLIKDSRSKIDFSSINNDKIGQLP